MRRGQLGTHVRQARVARRVLHFHQGVRIPDGVVAEGDVARGLRQFEAGAGLEPLAVAVDQRDQGDGRIAQHRGEPDDIVVGRFGQGVEDAVGVEFALARVFVG